MNDDSRKQEELLGYLLGALDDAEQQAVEVRLRSDAGLRAALGDAKRSLAPLYASDDAALEPPSGLAERTCELVHRARSSASVVKAAAPPGGPVSPRWKHWLRLPGAIVAAGLMMGASVLLFPAILADRGLGPTTAVSPTAQPHLVRKVESRAADRLDALDALAESEQERTLARGQGPGNHPQLLLKLAQQKKAAGKRIRGDSKLAATAVDPDEAIVVPSGELTASASSSTR